MNNDENIQIDPLENLKKELIRLYENTDDNVLSVGYGCKSTNGVYTEEKCISFGVAKKLSENEILPEKIIPKTITVDGIVFKTDVYETEIAESLSSVLYIDDNQECSAYQLVIDDDDPSVIYIHIRELNGLCGNRKALFYHPADPQNNNEYIYIPIGSVFCFDKNAPQNFPSQFSGMSNGSRSPAGVFDPINKPYHFEEILDSCATAYCCNECDGITSVPPESISGESFDHKQNIRPLKGGISVHQYQDRNFSPSVNPDSGTLGGIVIDSLDGKMVGITNAHVAGTAGQDRQRNLIYTRRWPGGLQLHRSDQVFTDGAESGAKIGAYYESFRENKNIQPSYGDGYNSMFGTTAEYVNNQSIGTSKRTYPIVYSGNNEIDCTLINLNNSNVSTDSWKQLGLTALTTPAPFATTVEINNITINTPVMFSGRTSGVRGASTYNKGEQNNNSFYSRSNIQNITNLTIPNFFTVPIFIRNQSGPTECLVKVTHTSNTTGVKQGVGYVQTQNYVWSYSNVIRFQTDYPNLTLPIIGGDSGSLLYAFINNQWKIIGLNFAGSVRNGLACRIDRVAALMNVEPYLGTTVNANPNIPIDRALPYELYKSQESVTMAGKKYWLVGRTKLELADAFELET